MADPETITPVTSAELLDTAEHLHASGLVSSSNVVQRAAASLQAYERERAEAESAEGLLAACKRLLTDLRVVRRESGHMSYELGHLCFGALEQIWLAVEKAERGKL